MTAANMTNQAAIYKTIWPQTDLVDTFHAQSPLLGLMPKDTSWDGDIRKIVVEYGGTNGRSASYAAAYANRNATKVKSMAIETADNFSLFNCDHKAITLARNKKGAVVQIIERQTRGAIYRLRRNTSAMLWGNGGGASGQIDSTTTLASTTLKLRNPRQVRNFEDGDVLAFSTDDGTGGAGTLTGTLTVTGVNYKTAELTLNANLSTIGGMTTSCYVFIEGDYAAAIKGVPYYVPRTDALVTDTTAWGMNRSANIQRLGGVRVGGKGLPIIIGVKKLLTALQDAGAETSHIWMGTNKFDELDSALGTQKRYCDEKSGGVGFSGISFTSHGKKPVNIYSDADMDPDLVFGLNLSTWCFASAGEYPDWLTLDGKRMESEEASNTFAGKIGGYSQVYTEAPGQNGVLDLTAT